MFYLRLFCLRLRLVKARLKNSLLQWMVNSLRNRRGLFYRYNVLRAQWHAFQTIRKIVGIRGYIALRRLKWTR